MALRSCPSRVNPSNGMHRGRIVRHRTLVLFLPCRHSARIELRREMNNGALAIDAMGGDRGRKVIAGIALAHSLGQIPEELIVVGHKDVLTPLLDGQGLMKHGFLRIHHAPEVIGMGEKPTDTLRKKRNSSMLQGIELVKEGKAQAILSCGNTGSLMAGGTVRLRPLEGVERPALATVMPGAKRNGKWCLRCWRNPEANRTSRAQRRSHYMRGAHGIANPKVGLLSIGQKKEKEGKEFLNHTKCSKAKRGYKLSRSS